MPRDNYISIKASPDEKLKLKLEATRLGMSLSDYIRMRALDTLGALGNVSAITSNREEVAK